MNDEFVAAFAPERELEAELQRIRNKKGGNNMSLVTPKCGFPIYGIDDKRCTQDAIDDMVIQIDSKQIKIPICQHHAETWHILWGQKGLAKLIRDNKLWL